MTAINTLRVETIGGEEALAPANFVMSNLLAANVAESLTVPTDSTSSVKARYVFFKSTGDFYAQAFTATQVANQVTNGTFDADASWTKGTGWTIAAGVATATGAISTALAQTISTLIPGQAYSVVFTATRSAGSVTPSLGGTVGTARSTSATFTEVIVCGTSNLDLSFGTSGFSGTVDVVSVTPVAAVPGDTTGGGASELNPDKWFLGGDISTISIVSAATPIVCSKFYM